LLQLLSSVSLLCALAQASPYDVTVTAPAPPRSASESVRDREALTTAPHKSADELMMLVPGMFITQHGGEGKAFQIFYRGFDAVHGQDVEISAGGIPVNDVSNLHGQGYADLHFLPAEVVEQVQAMPGPYNPHQGDFAVAGSLQLTLGFDEPGITLKSGLGSFGARRQFLAYRPPEANRDTFAAVELYHTDGFGPSRAADRASVVAQSVWALPGDLRARLLLSSYAGRFSSAGVLPESEVERGMVDRFETLDSGQGGASSRSQLLLEVGQDSPGLRTGLSAYAVMRGMRLRQNFTGFLRDPSGDLQQQGNDALTAGSHGFFRKRMTLLSPLDTVEAGYYWRTDFITQSQRRLSSVDGSVTANEVQADVQANNLAAYVDTSLHPFARLTLRGGIRFDALSYTTTDTGAEARGQSRSSQGLHTGPKMTADVLLWSAGHLIVSYGEGFRSPQARSLADGEATPFTKVRSAEMGLRTAGLWGAASVAAFATRLSRDLVFDPATTRNEEVPGSQRIGGSLDLRWQPRPSLVVNAGATYTQARFTSTDSQYRKGDLLPYVPQIVARTDVAYRRTLGSINNHPLQGEIGTGWSLLARRPLPYSEFGTNIFLVDGAFRLRYRAVAASIQVWNLANSDWYDGVFVYAAKWKQGAAASLVPERFVTIGNPRTVLVDLTLFL
jgi:iron complex outermembrane recepter protein